MKKIYIVFLFVLIFGSGFLNLESRESNKGIGFFVGNNSGLTGTYGLEFDKHIDVKASWSFSGEDEIYICGDYRLDSVFKNSEISFKWFYGFGGFVYSLNEDSGFGGRLPFGVKHDIYDFDVFMEMSPVVNLFPDIEIYFSLALGLRYYL